MLGRLHSRGRPGVSDLPALVAAVLLALAAGVSSARNILLAAALFAGVVWIAWDAAVTDRPGPRARLVMATALLLLTALPGFLLAADSGLWVGTFPGLSGGLALLCIGVVSLAAGSRAAGLIPSGRLLLPRAPSSESRLHLPTPARARGPQGAWLIAAIVLVSLAAFVYKVGGPSDYIHNLNNSGLSTQGLTYFIWGILFAKFGSFAYVGEAWARGERPSPRAVAATALALLLLLFVASRLLLLVALIQLLLLYAAVRPPSRRFKLALAGTVLVGVLAFLVIGEFRRWENVPAPRPSFPSYLANTSVEQLPKTYVNDYADAVRLSVLARRVVPSRAPYENGKELLRVLLQPLPGGIRPTVSTAPALSATFTGANKNANALPVPVEGYIEFGFAGVVLFSLILGLFTGLVDRVRATGYDIGWLVAGIAAGSGAVIVFRGSLHNAIAIAGIDVLGFFIAHRMLFKRPALAVRNYTRARAAERARA